MSSRHFFKPEDMSFITMILCRCDAIITVVVQFKEEIFSLKFDWRCDVLA